MNLKISRILHAGYIFQTEKSTIAFDPLFENPFSVNCYAYPNVEFDYDQIKKLKLDAVFISHYHDDHCSLESLNWLDKNTPIYMYTIFDVFTDLIKNLGFTQVYQLSLNEPIIIGDITVTPWPALDIDVDSIFQIKTGSLNILNLVDSWIDAETLNKLEKQRPWDLILQPFQTMREIEVLSPSRFGPADRNIPVEWIQQLQTLRPKCIIPSSCQFIQEDWSWYQNFYFPITYKNFELQINQVLPESKVIKLNPSESLILNSQSIEKSLSLPWIKTVGEADVDYKYNPDLVITSTQDLSKKFSALSFDQHQEVINYCQNDLVKKYQSLELIAESYFNIPQIWQLSIFNHLGVEIKFFYEIFKNKIILTKVNPAEITWLTEICAFKLYSALKNAESLSSLYIRINDIHFSSDVEKLLKSADLLEDPLIRSLYEGSVATYQKEQLKRIQSDCCSFLKVII